MIGVQGACLPPEKLLARHATRNSTSIEFACRRRSKNTSIGGQVRHLKVKRTNVAHRLPRGKRASGTEINHFQ
ncbi:hypothetical protein QUF49_01860 [Fictibacillus sp. b24]|uniref:hypothetical protein n=1 Tax=Fictibacillus sp. b24 TaxID=3055863 RepID=UPI0025A110AF|nr:hypothetical protein [Fictibacillus sp. b24]MDM5314717.1 hypothetical protein [Fictibacillus sp. b24]